MAERGRPEGRTLTIHELFSYGPIVAHDEELDLLVTIDAAALRLFAGDEEGNYTQTASRPLDTACQGLLGYSVPRALQLGRQYLKKLAND